MGNTALLKEARVSLKKGLVRNELLPIVLAVSDNQDRGGTYLACYLPSRGQAAPWCLLHMYKPPHPPAGTLSGFLRTPLP